MSTAIPAVFGSSRELVTITKRIDRMLFVQPCTSCLSSSFCGDFMTLISMYRYNLKKPNAGEKTTVA